MHYDVQGEDTIKAALYCMNHKTFFPFLWLGQSMVHCSMDGEVKIEGEWWQW